MNALEELINKLVNDNTIIILHPETQKKMVQQGLPIEETRFVPIDEAIPLLFEKRKSEAVNIAKSLPSRPNFILPAINEIYDEIYQCILFGLNGAAITLCGILIEFTLKQVVYFYKNDHKFVYDPDSWDTYENTTMGPVIEQALALKIVNQKQADKLTRFKNDIRNSYNHYNIKKITKDVIANKVKKVNTKTLQVEEVTLSAEEAPFIQGIAKRHLDKALVRGVFDYTDV